MASVTRVGNFLGENSSSKASLAAKVAPLLAGIISCLISLTLYMYNRQWCALFTDDGKVIALLCHIFPVLVVYTVADGIQSSLTGVLKGLGKQAVAGPIVVFSYYVIGLPISVMLAFPLGGRGYNMDLMGLVIGTTVGTYTHMLLFALVVSRTHWRREAGEIHHLTELKSLLVEVNAEIALLEASSQGQSNSIANAITSALHASESGDAGGDSTDAEDNSVAPPTGMHALHQKRLELQGELDQALSRSKVGVRGTLQSLGLISASSIQYHNVGNEDDEELLSSDTEGDTWGAEDQIRVKGPPVHRSDTHSTVLKVSDIDDDEEYGLPSPPLQPHDKHAPIHKA